MHSRPRTTPVAAIGLGLAALPGLLASHALAASTVLYDVDFGVPHLVDFAPIEGAEPVPRYLVSEIERGAPLVVADLGALVDTPLLLDSSDGEGDQIAFDLTEVPTGDYYTYESWVLVESAGTDGDLSILFDTPAVRRLDFQSDGTVYLFADGSHDLGTYALGAPVFVQVTIDLLHDYISVSLDGDVRHEGSFGGASLIEAIRVGTPVIAAPPSLVCAVDDIVITTGQDDSCDRLGFGDLVTNTQYVEGELFETGGVWVTVGPHYFAPGPCSGGSTSGFCEVQLGGLACGAGRELELNNVSLDFDFGGPVRDVVIPYGFYGGTMSLSVNDDCLVVDRPRDLNGINLGGAAVTVFDFDGQPEGCGVIRVGGIVDQLSVSGQEFFIDNLSFCRDCDSLVRSAFDDQTVGTSFGVGDSFTSGGATHTLRRFYQPGASCTNPVNTGTASIGAAGLSCQDGNELQLNNINTEIDFGATLGWLTLAYGEFGGNVNLEINDDCRNLDDLSDVNGSVVGGATVWAVDYGTPGQSCGTLYVVGTIDEFRIGGQEFWIDNVRSCPEVPSGLDSTNEQPELAGGAVLLLDNRPNPMREETRVRFELGESLPVALSVFDVAGREVRSLFRGSLEPGRHEFVWDGRDEGGSPVSSGIYWYRVDAGHGSTARRLVVTR